MIIKLFKKKIIIILFIGVVLMVAISLFVSNRRGSLSPSPTPTINPSPKSGFEIERPSSIPNEEEIISQEIDETKKLYPLIDWIPIDNDRYHLTYSKPGMLQVILKKGNQEEARKEIVDWIRSKGVEPQTHQIIFK